MRAPVLFHINGTLIRDGGASASAFELALRDLFGVVAAASAPVDKHGRFKRLLALAD
jgi:hypothetical protein